MDLEHTWYLVAVQYHCSYLESAKNASCKNQLPTATAYWTIWSIDEQILLHTGDLLSKSHIFAISKFNIIDIKHRDFNIKINSAA